MEIPSASDRTNIWKVNGIAGPLTRCQKANSSIADEDCASESIVVDESRSRIIKLHLRPLENIQEDLSIQDPEAGESLELRGVAEADTLPRVVDSASSLPAAPNSDILMTDELDEWGLAATHLVAAIDSIPVDLMDLSVSDFWKYQSRSTEELNC
jgi:hypothetical protein